MVDPLELKLQVMLGTKQNKKKEREKKKKRKKGKNLVKHFSLLASFLVEEKAGRVGQAARAGRCHSSSGECLHCTVLGVRGAEERVSNAFGFS